MRSGALGDLGSQVVDLARFLIGDPESVSASLRTFTVERPGGHIIGWEHTFVHEFAHLLESIADAARQRTHVQIEYQ